MKPNAFTTIQRARSLRTRHPEARPSVCHVALVMATYANGKTGASIRPGVARLVESTGLHRDTVQDAIEWLVKHDELRRDKPGHRGSAACFTYVGGKVESDTPPFEGMEGRHTGNAGVSDPYTNQINQPPPGLPGPPGVAEAGESREDGPHEEWPAEKQAASACCVEGCGLAGIVNNFDDQWCEAHAAEQYYRQMRGQPR
jgi:hypothetical protein